MGYFGFSNPFISQSQAKKDIEDARKAGKPFTDMDSAHQEALHSLLKQSQPQASNPSDPLDDEVKRKKMLGQPQYK